MVHSSKLSHLGSHLKLSIVGHHFLPSASVELFVESGFRSMLIVHLRDGTHVQKQAYASLPQQLWQLHNSRPRECGGRTCGREFRLAFLERLVSRVFRSKYRARSSQPILRGSLSRTKPAHHHRDRCMLLAELGHAQTPQNHGKAPQRSGLSRHDQLWRGL